MENIRIRVCTSCSKVDLEKLQTAFPEATITPGCVGACAGGVGHYFASVNTNFVKGSSDETLIEAIQGKIAAGFDEE